MQHRVRIPLTILLVTLVLAGCADPQPTLLFGETADAAGRVSGAVYPDLVVEIDHLPDARPDPRTIQYVVDIIQQVTDKREVRVVGPTEEGEAAPLGATREWDLESFAEAHEVMADVATAPFDDDAAYLHVLFLDGRFAMPNGTWAVGVSIGHLVGVFRMHGDTPDSPVYPDAAQLRERATFLHEIGHALGLVDNGAPVTFDRVASDGVHSTRAESVMNPYVELANASALRQILDYPDTFDQYDLADLAALRDLAEQNAARRR